MNWELPDVQAGFRTDRGTRDQIANIHWITEQARELKKKKSASLMTLKPLTVWIITNWKILKETTITNYLTCLLRNLFTGQEATVRTRHVIMDCFKIGKGVHQGSILSPCLFNLYRVHHAKMPGWMKIARRNINNFTYADDTILMAESKEELKILLMKVKEEWKSWLKTQYSEN